MPRRLQRRGARTDEQEGDPWLLLRLTRSDAQREIVLQPIHVDPTRLTRSQNAPNPMDFGAQILGKPVFLGSVKAMKAKKFEVTV